MRRKALRSAAAWSVLAGLGAALLSACNPPADQQVAREPVVNVPFVPDISINEIMVGQVDHAANQILKLSMADQARLTIGDWQELEHSAIQLISSTSAITMGGAGVNDAMWVAQIGWRDYTSQLNTAATSALRAIRSKDLPALLSAADGIRESCDGCHQQYKPDTPTEGFYRAH
ncbi:MAG: hypothetical protein R3F41_04570 [Gammaproteobacteria bacterium]|nr:cytochrome c [Pseudomonadales bacterium]MCP5345431.1 cytochrome c [Pseudomonadales bacterium]